MPSLTPSFRFCLFSIVLLASIASPALAFGAGNIGELVAYGRDPVIVDPAVSVDCPH